jgi:hypothetical protein
MKIPNLVDTKKIIIKGIKFVFMLFLNLTKKNKDFSNLCANF